MREVLTTDVLLGGALTLLQPRDGYRVNADAFLLAAFASAGRRPKLTLDLGAGVGSIALALHVTHYARELALIEREAALLEIATRNLEAAGADGTAHRADLATDGLPRALVQRADLVVSNPPFFEPGAGRAQVHPRTYAARSGELEPFVKAAARALAGPRARACFVYPARSLTELILAAHAVGLVPKRLRLVQATADVPARVALAELRLAKPGGLVVEPPLVEWSRPGVRTPELRDIVAGRFVQRSPRKRSNKIAAAARTLK
jgi:tRNA1Val (adenine37-N6)-methyltransferase